MQGFARPVDGKFSQLLQDLDLSFSEIWRPEQISYHRFGSVIETISQRPFYAAAARDDFFRPGKEYATTRIDNVFRKSSPGRMTVVMTDLFEQDLDISSIQQALRGAFFPERTSLAIWQWRMPFSGPVFDFDFRVQEGRNFTGDRYLYMLALGKADAIEKLRASIEHTLTVGKPNYLLLSNRPVKVSANWLTVTQTSNAALKSRFSGSITAKPFSIYRTSRGCSTASITGRPELMPGVDGSPSLTSSGTYKESLVALENKAGKWSSRDLGESEPSLTKDRAGYSQVNIQVNCPDITQSQIVLLRLRRIGTGNDILLPDWITASSASSMAFNEALRQKHRDWGLKTLNLAPFIRGLANTAVERTDIAVAYIYFVAS